MYGKTEIHAVRPKLQFQVLDIVEAVFASNHHLVCAYEVLIREDGVIYCNTCGIQINSVWTYE